VDTTVVVVIIIVIIVPHLGQPRRVSVASDPLRE
jgi:hypothetical protein